MRLSLKATLTAGLTILTSGCGTLQRDRPVLVEMPPPAAEPIKVQLIAPQSCLEAPEPRPEPAPGPAPAPNAGALVLERWARVTLEKWSKDLADWGDRLSVKQTTCKVALEDQLKG